MDCCIGQEFIISKIDLDDNSVKFEEKVWWFPMQSLTLISNDIEAQYFGVEK